MTGKQKPGGLAQKIYDCPTTFDGDAIGTHLGMSMMVDQSTSTVEEQRRVVMSMCEDIAKMIQAEPAEARIRELEARVAELLRESAAIAEGRRFQRDRATAAEAKLARAVEGLERIVHWRVEMNGTPVDTEAANAWAITFDAAATEAAQALSALQPGGER